MKTKFYVILIVLVAIFYSCEKDEVSGKSSSITSDGVLSGTIMDYTSATLDSVNVYDDYSYIGRSNITTDGKFSISLSVPKLRPIGSAKGVTISDTTALVGYTSVFCYKAGIRTGALVKLNYNPEIDSIRSGLSGSSFMYANKPFTMNGTQTYSYSSGVYSFNAISVYNLKFKKGWNEIVGKEDSYSSNGTSSTEQMTKSNIITSDLQWRYLPYPVFGVRSDAKGLSGLKSGKLFIE